MNRFVNKNTFTATTIILILTAVFSSCGSSRTVMYNPQEVAYLEQLLRIPISTTDKDMALFAESSLWLGVPYRYAGTTKMGVDCSGLTNQVFRTAFGKKLERSTSLIYKKNIKKVGKGSLRPGDLVFFKISRQSKDVDHVGIFLRNGYFIHASTSKGVIISHLDEDYYKKHWKKGGRVK